MAEAELKTRFQCHYCDLTFTQKFARTRHEKQQHREMVPNPDPLFKCPVVDCEYETTRIPDLRSHYHTVHLSPKVRKPRKNTKKSKSEENTIQDKTASPPPTIVKTQASKPIASQGDGNERSMPNEREGPPTKTTKRKRAIPTCSATPAHKRDLLKPITPDWVKQITHSVPSDYTVPRIKITATATSGSSLNDYTELEEEHDSPELKKKESKRAHTNLSTTGMPLMPTTSVITSPPRYTAVTSPISEIGDETITILRIPESEPAMFKFEMVDQPLDLTIKNTRMKPSDNETMNATDYLETLLQTSEPPRIISVQQVKSSPASAETEEYRYVDDSTPTKDEADTSDHTEPASNPPFQDNANGDLEMSDSDTDSSSVSAESEVTTRRARFKALFYIDDIGEHTTEIRVRTPKLYNCTQS